MSKKTRFRIGHWPKRNIFFPEDHSKVSIAFQLRDLLIEKVGNLGSAYSFVSDQEFLKVNSFSGEHGISLDNNGLIVADDYVYHLFFGRGGMPLKKPSSIEEGLFFACSKDHGYRVFPPSQKSKHLQLSSKDLYKIAVDLKGFRKEDFQIKNFWDGFSNTKLSPIHGEFFNYFLNHLQKEFKEFPHNFHGESQA